MGNLVKQLKVQSQAIASRREKKVQSQANVDYQKDQCGYTQLPEMLKRKGYLQAMEGRLYNQKRI